MRRVRTLDFTIPYFRSRFFREQKFLSPVQIYFTNQLLVQHFAYTQIKLLLSYLIDVEKETQRLDYF